jgi:hypothetical protein
VTHISASNFPQHFLWFCLGLWRHSELSPPLSLGCIPLDCLEEIPPGANRQLDLEGDSSFQRVGVRALDAQQNLVRCRNQRGEGSTAYQTVRTQVQTQTCLRRQKGRLITSQRPLITTFWGETVSLRFREWGGSTVLCESV